MQNQASQNLENFQELLKKIMHSTEYNLDPFIYDKKFVADNLKINHKILDDFFDLLYQIVLDKGEKYFLQLMEDNAEYKNCTDFFSWLYEYAKAISDMYQKSDGIRKLDLTRFKQLFDYCLDNLILHDIGFEAAVNKAKEHDLLFHKDDFKSMRELIHVYYSSIFINGNSKNYIDNRIYKTVGISKDKCSLFWEKYLQYEDALWKKYSLKLQNEINNKLDLFIKAINAMDEEE